MICSSPVVMERRPSNVLNPKLSKYYQTQNNLERQWHLLWELILHSTSDYARSLARERKFKEAVSVFSLCSRLATLPMESIRELVDNLIEAYSGHAYKKTCYTDPWSCVFCATVLVEPVTLACGHSCCKKCLLKDLTGVCKKCGNKYEPIDEDPIDEAEHVKVLVEKLEKQTFTYVFSLSRFLFLSVS